MISVDGVSKRVTDKDLKIGDLLASVALQALSSAIPIVHFNGLVINMCSVNCHRLEPAMVGLGGWEQYLESLWCQISPREFLSR